MSSSALLATAFAASAKDIFSAAGPDISSIQFAVDQFRLDLGTLNPNVSGSFGNGRREIDWDAVPNAFAAAYYLPGDFFNVDFPRGVILTTPGTGVQVSANASNPIQFGNLGPNFASSFDLSVCNVFSPLWGATLLV